MSFGPKNVPIFYTTSLKILHNERVVLFNSIKDIVPFDTYVANIFCDNKTIIDEILIYSNHILTFLYYFSFVAQVITKYRSYSR